MLAVLRRGAATLLSLSRRIARFQFDHILFSIRSTDIFIVSYPRSGTTWVQMIVYQLCSGGDRNFEHISDVSPFYDRMRARDGASHLLEGTTSRRIFKSHLPYGSIPKGKCRYIYVMRNGEDVAVSYYHFYRSHLRFHGKFAEFFDNFLQGKVQYGNWVDHVVGWWSHRQDTNILLLHYEDLLADLPGSVRRIAEFCQLEVDEGALPSIVEACTFDSMKVNERQFDHVWEVLSDLRLSPNAFLREGKAGQGKQVLTEQQRSEISRALELRLGKGYREFANELPLDAAKSQTQVN
jgi:hypothetical protein